MHTLIFSEGYDAAAFAAARALFCRIILSENCLLKVEEHVRIQQGHIERYDGTVFRCE